jgi:hypothetical protein
MKKRATVIIQGISHLLGGVSISQDRHGTKKGLPKHLYFLPWKPSFFEIWM